jgi:hypothetical protein
VKKLGVIKIEVRRSVETGKKEIRDPKTRPMKPNQKFELSEKAMKGKAISHGTA